LFFEFLEDRRLLTTMTAGGPGGFLALGSTSEVEAWFRADAGVEQAGGTVSVWRDQSGRGDDATRLATVGPTVATSATLNDLPVLRFVRSTTTATIDDLRFTGVSHAAGNDLSFLAVVQPDASFTIGNQIGFFLGSTVNANDTTKIGAWNSPTFFRRISNGGNQGTAAWPTDPGTPEPRIIYVQRDADNSITSAFDGATPGSELTQSATSRINRIGGPTDSATNNQDWPGDIAELAFFGRPLNSVEQTLACNYLASKYNISLNTAGGAFDKYAGDTAGAGNYDLDVFGIGHDGTSSVATAGNGGFGIEATGGTLDAGEFILAGHRVPSNSVVTSVLPGGVDYRWDRVWYVDTNGGSVDADLAFGFKDAGLTPPVDGVTYTLLRSATSGPLNFSAAATAVSSGGRVVFPVSGLSDGYYTLGGVQHLPTAVADTATTDEATPIVMPANYADIVRASDPLIYWRLGETNKAADQTSVNAATGPSSLGAAGNGLYGGAVGNVSDTSPVVAGDTAASFGATTATGSTGDQVTLNPFSSFPQAAFTFEMWVRSTRASADNPLVSYAHAGDSNESLLMGQGGALRLFLNGANASTGVTTATVFNGQWNHLVVTWDKATGALKTYLNGALAGSATFQAGATIDIPGSLMLGQEQDSLGGGFDNAQKFVGDLDEFALYSRALTAGEVAVHYLGNGGVLSNDSDLDAHDVLSVVAVNEDSSAVGVPTILPSGARLTLTADGGYTYDPHGAFELLPAGEATTDTFTYTVMDSPGGGIGSVGTVTVTITGLNDPPVANDDFADAVENGPPVSIDLTQNDEDVDAGTDLKIMSFSGVSELGATVTRVDGDHVSYDPNSTADFESLAAGETVEDSFPYTVTDAVGLIYDGFEEYPAGPLENSGGVGRNGGIGWSDGWNVVNSYRSNITVVSGGLNYANGEIVIDGGDRSLQVQAQGNEWSGTPVIASRSIPETTGDVYMSLLVRTSTADGNADDDFSQWGLHSSINTPAVSVTHRRTGSDHDFQARSKDTYPTAGTPTEANRTYLLVIKASKNSLTNYNRVQLWVDPESATVPGTPNATANADSGVSSLSQFVARLAFLEAGDTYWIDEVRVGTTWESVTGFSTDSASVFVTVTGVNDAPVLTAASPSLPAITEDETNNGGQSVADLVGASIVDVDDGALQGIAVTGATVTSGNGTWQYSLDAGNSWTPIGTVSETGALLLAAQDRVRFLPDGQNGATAGLTYRAWDQTGSTAGGEGTKADIAALGTGGTTPFSVATDAASISVTDVNDPPVASDDFAATDEDSVLTFGSLVGWRLATEGFEDYAADIQVEDSNGDGLDSGTGWSGAWNVADARRGDVTVVSGGLSYSNGEIVVHGRSRALQYAASDGSNVALAARRLPAQSGTLYLSFLYQQAMQQVSDNDFLQVGFATSFSEPLASGLDDGAFKVRSGLSSTTGGTVSSNVVSTDAVTHLLVLRIEKTSGNTYNNVRLYVNPQYADEELNTSVVSTANGGLNLSSSAFLVIRKANTENGDRFLFDEFRIGETFESVIGNPPTLLDNDTDVDGDALTVFAVEGSESAVGNEIVLPSGALLTVAAQGTFTYNPNGAFEYLAAGETAVDSFAYTAGDGHGGTGTATVSITIHGLNDAPQAADDFGQTDEDTILYVGAHAGGLLANDSDPDVNDTLNVLAVNGSTAAVGNPLTLASGAELTVQADGSYSYNPSPALNWLGAGDTFYETFTYVMSDGPLNSQDATVTITVTGVNDPPVAADDHYATNEDTVLTVPGGHDAPLAYDGFEDYASGSQLEDNSGVGLAGGTGWTEAWNVADNRRAAVTVVGGGLSYAAGQIAIDGGDRALRYVATEGGVQQIASRAIPVQSGTVYLSFLYNNTVDLAPGSSADDFIQLGFGDSPLGNPLASAIDQSVFKARSGTQGSGTVDSAIVSTPGQTFFLVLKAEKDGSGNYNDVTLYVNPTSLDEASETPAVFVNNVASGLSEAAYLVLRKAFNDAGDTYLLDELRVGETYRAVVSPWPSLLANDTDPDAADSPEVTGFGPLDAAADAYVNDFTATTNYGNATLMQIKFGALAQFHRKAYMKFDLSAWSFDHTTSLADAALRLNFIESGGGTGGTTVDWEFEVFGLNDGDPGEDWAEGNGGADDNPAGEITWNNAPANNVATPNDVLGNATSLGTFTLHGRTGVVDFRSPALTAFLRASTANDLVTFIIRRKTVEPNTSTQSYVHAIASKEHATAGGPQLILTAATSQAAALTPRPDGGFTYDPTVSANLQVLTAGESVTDHFDYTITDGQGGFDTATAYVDVAGVSPIEIDMNLNFLLAGLPLAPGGDGNPDSVRLQLNEDRTKLQIYVNDLLFHETDAALAASETIVVTGSDDDDTLIVDFSNGNPIPAGGIQFDGGGQVNGDRLVLQNGAVDSVTHTFANAGSTVVISESETADFAGTSITYSQLEVTLDDRLIAGERIFGSTLGNETFVLSDHAPDPDGVAQSLFASDKHPAVAFANPGQSLTIGTATGADTLNVQGVDAAFDADLLIAGDANDTVNFRTTATDISTGNLTAHAERINVEAAVSTGGYGVVELSATGDVVVANGGSLTASAASVTLDAGRNLILQGGSSVIAGTAIHLLGGQNGDGSVIELLGTLHVTGDVKDITVTGGDGADQITLNPGVGHAADFSLIDGGSDDDRYHIYLGRLTGQPNAVLVRDSGNSVADQAFVYGTSEDDILTVHSNAAPQTGGSVRLGASEDGPEQRGQYTETLEFLTVEGGGGNDLFNVQPSQTAVIAIEGGAPGFGPGAGDVPQVVGDTLNFDSFGNTFSIVCGTIFTDDDANGAGPFKPLHYQNIENMPLDPLPGAENTFRFDMDAAAGALQDGYTSVLPTTLYGNGNTFGWNSPLNGFDRGTTGFTSEYADLLRDGHWNSAARTFTADVAVGWYLVSIKSGDKSFARDQLQVTNPDTGQILLDSASSPAGQIAGQSFVMLVTDGTLDLTFANTGGDPYWVVNGIEIRPGKILTFGSPAQPTKISDGISQTTFAGYNATPGELVTVLARIDASGDGVSDGPVRITTADAGPDLVGVQIRANDLSVDPPLYPGKPAGYFEYTLVHPSQSGTVYVYLDEVSGDQKSCLAIKFEAPPAWQFDFNSAGSPTQAPVAVPSDPDGYIGVLPTDLTSPSVGYGWLASPSSFDRGAQTSPLYSHLLRDGAWGSGPSAFRVQLPVDTYEVTVTFGDPSFARDRMNVTLLEGSSGDLSTVTNVATAAGQLLHRTFTATTNGSGALVVQFSDGGGDPYWSVAGLEVRKAAAVFDVVAPGGSPSADGASVLNYTVTNATVGAVYTISSTGGATIVDRNGDHIVDADPRYAGVQIVPISGTFTLGVQSPSSAGNVTVTLAEVNGASRGSVTQAYALPTVRRFDFDGSGGLTQTTPNFTSVRATTLYADAAGYGWVTSPSEFQRSAAGILEAWPELYQDGHWGSAARTFQVQVDNNIQTYDVRVHTGDRNFARDQLRITVEGAAAPVVVPATAANQFVAAVISGGKDTNNDGKLDITFADLGGDPYWTVNGVEVARSGNLPTLPPRSVISMGVNIASASEGTPSAVGSIITYTVNMDVEQSYPVTVAYTISGTATPGVDFVNAGGDYSALTGGTITFAPGETSKTISLQVIADSDVEPNETVIVTLGSPTAGATVDPGAAAATHEILNDDDPPPLPTSWRFDFGTSSSPPESGFTQVGASNAYNSTLGYGWQTTASTFSRSGPTPLLQDGHWGTNNTFLVDVEPGSYIVNVTVGDASFARNNIEVAVYDPNTSQFVVQIPNLTTAAGRFTHASTGKVSPNALKQMAIRVRSTGGDPYFTINALELFRVAEDPVRVHTLTHNDDRTVFSGSGATPGVLITVTTTLGTISGTDESDPYAGHQVVADGDGKFSFSVTPPAGGGSATFTTEEVTGKGKSNPTEYNYAVPAVRRFDFNGSGNLTQGGFTGVRGNTLYTATNGYGWTQTVSEFQRASAAKTSVALYQDGHWGSAERAFDVAVIPSTTYSVRVYVGDASFARNNIQVRLEEGTWTTLDSTGANQFVSAVLTGSSSDGRLNISIRNNGGDPYWVFNGIDVWQGPADSSNDPGVANLQASVWSSEMVGEPLTQAAVDAVLPVARDYWVSTGLADWQVAELYRTPVAIGDLSHRGALGVAKPEGIWLDASGAGLGWHTSLLTPNSQLLASSYDLLTVLTHELGHVLGHADLDPLHHPDHLMAGVLQPGTGRIEIAAGGHDSDLASLFGPAASGRGPQWVAGAERDSDLWGANAERDSETAPLTGTAASGHGPLLGRRGMLVDRVLEEIFQCAMRATDNSSKQKDEIDDLLLPRLDEFQQAVDGVFAEL